MRVLFADKLPDRARVRLASAGFEVRSEPKLDGERCIAYKKGSDVRLMSRNQKVINSSYPEIVEATEELLQGITPQNLHHEVDTGPAVGHEAR